MTLRTSQKIPVASKRELQYAPAGADDQSKSTTEDERDENQHNKADAINIAGPFRSPVRSTRYGWDSSDEDDSSSSSSDDDESSSAENNDETSDDDILLHHPLGFAESLKYVAQRGGQTTYKFKLDDWSSDDSDSDDDDGDGRYQSATSRILARYENQSKQEENHNAATTAVSHPSSTTTSTALSAFGASQGADSTMLMLSPPCNRLSQYLTASRNPVDTVRQRSLRQQFYNESSTAGPIKNVLEIFERLSVAPSIELQKRTNAQLSSLRDSQSSSTRHMAALVEASRKGDRAVAQLMQKENERIRREETVSQVPWICVVCAFHTLEISLHYIA
jgi:hypothetical protein